MVKILKITFFVSILIFTTPIYPNAREVERIGNCRLVIRNTQEIDGKCKYIRYKDGGLHIKSLMRPFVLADVDYNDGNGSFTAHWNGYNHSNYADERLGSVARKGSCFGNRDDSLRVCAWDK